MNTGHLHVTTPSRGRASARSRPAWRGPLLWGAGILAGLVTLGWLGLQVQPRPFPAYPPAGTPETVPLPAGLPAPVERFYRQTYGGRVPVITSAVITGRATLRPVPGGPAFPARFRFMVSSVSRAASRLWIITGSFSSLATSSWRSSQ